MAYEHFFTSAQMIVKWYVVIGIVVMQLVHVAPAQGQTGNESLVYAQIKKERGMTHGWKPEWNVFIANAIDTYGEVLVADSSLSTEQWKELCPSYSKATRAQRKALWVLIIAGMVKYESGFDAESRFLEPPPLNQYSEGLLQLSYSDAKHYKDMPLDQAKKNIFDPEVNLTAGVIVLAYQVKKMDVLFTKKHFYWSVLTNRQPEIKAFVKEYIAELGIEG